MVSISECGWMPRATSCRFIHHGSVVQREFNTEPNAVIPAAKADQRATLTGVGACLDIRIITKFYNNR